MFKVYIYIFSFTRLELYSNSPVSLQRVDHLLKQEKFTEALSLAWSFHEGTAKAVLGELTLVLRVDLSILSVC